MQHFAWRQGQCDSHLHACRLAALHRSRYCRREPGQLPGPVGEVREVPRAQRRAEGTPKGACMRLERSGGAIGTCLDCGGRASRAEERLERVGRGVAGGGWLRVWRRTNLVGERFFGGRGPSVDGYAFDGHFPDLAAVDRLEPPDSRASRPIGNQKTAKTRRVRTAPRIIIPPLPHHEY